MSPLLVMPTGRAAAHEAVVRDLQAGLTAARCAIRLLRRHLDDPTRRALCDTVERELTQALSALRRLA